MNRWINAFSTASAMVGDARFEKVDDYTVKIAADKPILLFPWCDRRCGAAGVDHNGRGV